MNRTKLKKGMNLVLNLDIRRKDFMPDKFPFPTGETRETFAKKIIDVTNEIFSIVKVNFQFISDLSEEKIKNLVEYIECKGLIPWVDYKLGDIGTTNDHSLYNLNNMGFKGITIHQIIGFEDGVSNILNKAQKYKMDVISLAYMSHKGAKNYFNVHVGHGKRLYEKFIEDGIEWGVTGFVIGATIKIKVLSSILKKFPKDKEFFILIPGFGAQRGNYSILKLFKSYENIIPLPSNGREIIYAWVNPGLSFPEACRSTALKFKEKIQKYLN
ncbi:MAG: orotidine 5'-phosphate decarboxylase / HUMPS family protein [Candidatus Helarchaeota archaeon]